MRITTLLENTTELPALACQHGLSQYVEANGRFSLTPAPQRPPRKMPSNWVSI